ncbi:MAG: hemerythrin domain-containing protein [Deltaproteobacteria bacterium]|nr:hemerythrin domain-containing protein [Deltaproteobacteria bacterium]
MQPIGPLMIEHRLIERLIALMQRELTRMQDNIAVDREFAFVDPVFIDTAVDFMKTYADRCHHGKEENLLFAELAKKDLTPEHRQTLEELLSDHAWARRTTASLVEAKNDFLLDRDGALDDLLLHLEELVVFYPRHIAKEDQKFFIPCMAYFSEAEQAQLLVQMAEFDQKMIHEKYRAIVEGIEHHGACHIK